MQAILYQIEGAAIDQTNGSVDRDIQKLVGGAQREEFPTGTLLGL